VSRRLPSTPPELPGYSYVRLLGSGGFSDVFQYDQRLPRRKVAVKVLLTEQLNPQTQARFVDEANVMAQLSAHPYIVTIYHADVAADLRPYFVMEYCSGPSLAERYKQQRFEVADALRTGVRLSSAIATAHAAGILHRDIKPANVLTNDFGWPALTDFGISSTLEDELPVHTTTAAVLRDAARAPSGEHATGDQQSIGMSVPWSPPEMFADDPSPDVRSDVFSLAATIHTLLAGRTPFEIPGRPNGTLDLIGRIERGAITPLDRPDVPRSLVAVLQKGMAKNRTDRFATAVEFARALQRVELELGYAPTSIEVPNLGVARVSRDASAPAEDETRIRAVATVVAQPVQSQPPPALPPTAPPAAEPTRLRGALPVAGPGEATVLRPDRSIRPVPQHPPIAPTGPPGDADEVRPSSRRRGILVGVIVVCVLVVGGGVAAAILLPQVAQAPPSNTGVSNGGGDGGIVVSTVPDAVAGSVTRSADGTSVTFVWKNPRPKKADTYQWTQEGTSKPPVATSQPTAVVDSLAPGTPVCIDVLIIRDGRTSANALKECTP